jgi:hypothetical protein
VQGASLSCVKRGDLLQRKELPGLSAILILDAMIAKVLVALDSLVSHTLRLFLFLKKSFTNYNKY